MALQGLMQDGWPLCVTQIIDHAARWHGEQQVISRTVEGPTLVSTYAQVRERSCLVSLALRRLGVRQVLGLGKSLDHVLVSSNRLADGAISFAPVRAEGSEAAGGPGDRVATLAWNTVRHLEAWYGIAGTGAVCHTLNPRLFDKELEFIANHAADTLIMADTSFVELLERLAPKLKTVKHFIFLTDDRNMSKSTSLPGALCYEDLLAAEVPHLPAFAWEPCSETQACGLCYTSGTTGDPKGVLYSHRSNFLHALAIALPDSLDLRSDSSFLMVVPMFHANSWGIAFGAPLVGAKLVLPGPALDGPSVHSMMLEHSVTHTAGVPTVWLGLMEHMQTRGRGAGALKLMIVGGAACPRVLIEYFEGKGVDVRQCWGMTEISPLGTTGAMKGTLSGLLQGPEARTALKLKQGRPHIFLDMRIVGEGDQELAHDGQAFGNLQVRGPIAVTKYFNSSAPGADAQGWFDTGDVATLDRHGYMQITDRSKDVIKSGGEWISSIEIENLAVGCPGVAEAAVIGIPDEKWSERPLLVVVPAKNGSEGPTRDSVLAFLEGKIARWWMPDDVVFVEEIPHTATGKISKLQLRARFKGFRPARRQAGGGARARM